MSFAIGDRAPAIFGATADGRFYSLDAQAGRPAVLVALGALGPDGARRVLEQVRTAQAPLVEAGVDIVPIAPMGAGFSSAFAADAEARERIVYLADGAGLERCELDGDPAAIFIDASGRILDIWPLDGRSNLTTRHCAAAEAASAEAARRRTASAPVLIIPNLASRALCQALIDHFEASPHVAGVMASYSGGYFKRHRDNAAPHTAFREFAISLNLNTQDYEGGELLFPEYDDHRYSPAAGSAVIFSASLLHEAAPVTSGSRYVLLSFLCSAAGQARLADAQLVRTA